MCILLFLLLLLRLPLTLKAYDSDFPSANVSSSWENNPSIKTGTTEFSDGSILRPILLTYNYSRSYPPLGLGFFTNTSINPRPKSFYLILWCANRDNPVGKNATLDFIAEGDLILKDSDGRHVWSTGTYGFSVERMELTLRGNLVLLNRSGGIVWQSSDHPTDTWLPNQKIFIGRSLVARISPSNLSTGIYSLSVKNNGVWANLVSSHPKPYAILTSDVQTGLGSWSFGDDSAINAYGTYLQFELGNKHDDFRYIVMKPNGHLILYRVEKVGGFGFPVTPYLDVLNGFDFADDCSYPTVCGHYGVCVGGVQCRCPGEAGKLNYFRLVSESQPNLGCQEITPLSCKLDSQSQNFVTLVNSSYYDYEPVLSNVDVDRCKKKCLENCSCKGALFEPILNFTLFIQMPSQGPETRRPPPGQVQPNPNRPSYLVQVMVPSIMGGLVLVIFIAGICYFYRTPKKLKRADHLEEGDDQVIETLTRFSFEDLRSNTNNFQTKLGRGGFGTVFEGVLRDGTKVAVKCLDSVGQGRREFLAEVNTIGKVNHFNLVRLIGYCAKQSNKLLVYEYMCNGSLDKWIFNLDRAQTLQWKTRQKIIHGVAKGLEYLHECCSTKIIHFDIKPQNILLDEHFNAKISDFGLAKLIDRDQSLVLTRLKGTPGYLAPELFGVAHISVKADVYSFGIVILEIVCGRKNLDQTKCTPLIYKVREKAEKDRLCDLINEHDEDMHRHIEEAIRMIKIALWCLQTHDRRPSMSLIVKILEGSVELNSVTECPYEGISGHKEVKEMIKIGLWHLQTHDRRPPLLMVVKVLDGLADADIITEHHSISKCFTEINPNASLPPEALILSGPREGVRKTVVNL
ncbi:Non-specific serine/threonine protein kinase [Bertholletia excelsa]